jgi:DNA invertase Pin-like site-specific DNA recombinase
MRADDRKTLRCAIYTRKSTEHGLEQEFNSLDAQREACEAYIKSQASQGWKALPQHYEDPAYSGGNLDRPALKRLLRDIEAGQIDVVVVYKIDRLTRSLADFAKLVETFDARSISFVAVTQQFNTTTSMGRLTLKRAPVLCPVRAGVGIRASPGQGRRIPEEGQMDQGNSPAGL